MFCAFFVLRNDLGTLGVSLEKEFPMAQRLFLSDENLPVEERLERVIGSIKALSSTEDPRKMIEVFGEEVGSTLERDATISLTRRNVPAPQFQISRFSEWEDPIDPWLHPEKLPTIEGGILGDLIFGGKAVVINDLNVGQDDPAYLYLKDYRSLLSMPTFDHGEALNMTIMLDKKPDSFEVGLLPEIVWTANLFGRAIHNLRVGDALKEANRIIDHEVKVVAGIQLSLLPNGLPSIPGLELAVHYEAAQQAGGDYYDFFELPSGKWGILVADVSGHGPSAAVLMAITHTIAHTIPELSDNPADMLNFVNQHLVRRYTSMTKSFVTAFYGVYDPQTHKLTYAGAGHDMPLVLRSTSCDVLSPDPTTNMPLGVRATETYTSHDYQLEPGDFLILFTDGLFEAQNHDGECYGLERFTEAVRRCTDTPQGIIDAMMADLAAFASGNPAHDDQTILIAHIV